MIRESDLVVVALGSNLGDSRKLLEDAMSKLKAFSDGFFLRSSVYVTQPVDCPPGSPDFSNAVVALQPFSAETPETFFAKLQSLEKEFGRQPKQVPNEPRPLDLDLIVFKTETRNSGRLDLPHPRAHQRRFVLEPLNEILPGLILPGQKRSVRELLAALAAKA